MYAEGSTPTRKSLEQVRAMYRGQTPRKGSSGSAPPAAAGRAIPVPLLADPQDVIRPVARAFTRRGGLLVLHGNIARCGAVVKLAGVDPKMYRHSGPAVIFESQEDACAGILGGKVKAGQVVVIRNEGPRGGPGMQEMLAPTSYIKGMGLGDRCALITDGRFSGGTAGACIGHVSPEAAAGGEIGLLKPGDIIDIDLPGGKVNARVTAAEFAKRRKKARPRTRPVRRGVLSRYAQHATSADQGASPVA